MRRTVVACLLCTSCGVDRVYLDPPPGDGVSLVYLFEGADAAYAYPANAAVEFMEVFDPGALVTVEVLVSSQSLAELEMPTGRLPEPRFEADGRGLWRIGGEAYVAVASRTGLTEWTRVPSFSGFARQFRFRQPPFVLEEGLALHLLARDDLESYNFSWSDASIFQRDFISVGGELEQIRGWIGERPTAGCSSRGRFERNDTLDIAPDGARTIVLVAAVADVEDCPLFQWSDVDAQRFVIGGQLLSNNVHYGVSTELGSVRSTRPYDGRARVHVVRTTNLDGRSASDALDYRINGTQLTLVTAEPFGIGPLDTVTKTSICSSVAFESTCSPRVARVLVYDRRLSDAEVLVVEEALSAYYAIPLIGS